MPFLAAIHVVPNWTQHPTVVLVANAPGAEIKSTEDKSLVCVAPCGRKLPSGYYRVTGPEKWRSEELYLPPAESVRVDVDFGSRRWSDIGLVTTLVGGFGWAPSAIMLTQDNMRTGGAVGFAVSTAVVVAGIYMLAKGVSWVEVTKLDPPAGRP